MFIVSSGVGRSFTSSDEFHPPPSFGSDGSTFLGGFVCLCTVCEPVPIVFWSARLSALDTCNTLMGTESISFLFDKVYQLSSLPDHFTAGLSCPVTLLLLIIVSRQCHMCGNKRPVVWAGMIHNENTIDVVTAVITVFSTRTAKKFRLWTHVRTHTHTHMCHILI